MKKNKLKKYSIALLPILIIFDVYVGKDNSQLA